MLCHAVYDIKYRVLLVLLEAFAACTIFTVYYILPYSVSVILF
jgi:hypothetical protein